MTTEEGRVPGKFIVFAIREYLNQVLQFGYEHGTNEERMTYATVTVGGLKQHMSAARVAELAREAFDSLDVGKRHVTEGREWLRGELGFY
jgi:hypothetical protein